MSSTGLLSLLARFLDLPAHTNNAPPPREASCGLFRDEQSTTTRAHSSSENVMELQRRGFSHTDLGSSDIGECNSTISMILSYHQDPSGHMPLRRRVPW